MEKLQGMNFRSGTCAYINIFWKSVFIRMYFSGYREGDKTNGPKPTLGNLQSCENIWKYSNKDVSNSKGCQGIEIKNLSCF